MTEAAESPLISREPAAESTPSIWARFNDISVTRFLTSAWLAGCLFLGLKLLATALVLRRRLAVCRPVTDSAVLDLLESCRRRLNVKRYPALLVTPDSVSPRIVGTWNPRIVLPESVVTQSSTARLRHVLAHELAQSGAR